MLNSVPFLSAKELRYINSPLKEKACVINPRTPPFPSVSCCSHGLRTQGPESGRCPGLDLSEEWEIPGSPFLVFNTADKAGFVLPLPAHLQGLALVLNSQ